MHTRFSNKISKYYRVSLSLSIGQKSPAEQWFAGGVFAQLLCYIGKAAGLSYCLFASALFVRRFFRLRIRPPTLSPAWSPISASGRRRLVRSVRIFRRKPARLHALARPAYTSGSKLSSPAIHSPVLRSIGVRCFFRLLILFPVRSPALSPAWSPTSTSGRHGPARISRCKPALLHVRARPAYTFGAKLSPPATHSATLGCCAFVLEASAASTLHSRASTLHSRASVLAASAASTLHSRASALETSAASTLHDRASALEASTTSVLPAPNVLSRSLTIRAILTSGSLEIVRPCRFGICAHSRPAGHSASPSLPAAATSTASSRPGNSLRSQNRYCQHSNDPCFESCLFHFRFLSQKFHFSAFLSPVLGSFYQDSGADGKKVTPGVNFSGKNIRSHIFLHPCSDYRVNLV